MEKLSKEQIEEYRAAFDLYDLDCNDYITTKELGSIMKTLGFNPTEEDLQQMIFTVDYDGDGRLSFQEYVQLMEQQKTPDDKEDDIVQAFRVFDSDGKGYIDSADLKYTFENMDWKIPEEDLNGMLAYANIETDRRVSFEEFAWLVDPDGLPEKGTE